MKSVICLTLILSLLCGGLFLYFEPESALAVTASGASPQSLTAVATLTVGAEISLSITSTSIPMAPDLTMTVNTATGVGVWVVETTNLSGWSLTLKTDRANSLYNTASTTIAFTEYTATSGAPSVWSVTSGQYQFGFNVFGADTASSTWGEWPTSAGCGTPGNALKYAGFAATTAITVASSDEATSPSGRATTMCLAAAQNAVYAPSGSYQANITATALAQ